MDGVIQDTYASTGEYDFFGDPTTGTNRLVSVFTITANTVSVIQDSYTSAVSDIIQDEIG
jgi:hypothetical protein